MAFDRAKFKKEDRKRIAPIKKGLYVEENTLKIIPLVSDDILTEVMEKDRVRPTDKLERPPVLLSIKDKTWATNEGISIVSGPAKARKTFLITAAVSAILSGKLIIGNLQGSLLEGQKKIYYFDTEQSSYSIIELAKRIVKLSGVSNTVMEENLIILKLKRHPTKTRLIIIDKLIMESDDIGMVIIDGVRDLVTDINSPDQSTMVSNYIEKWVDEKKIHVVGAIHTNKNDNNLRGHIGTELLNKSETVISVTKSNVNKDVSIVSCKEGRHREFDDFAFKINNDGIPIEAEIIPAKASVGRKPIEFHDPSYPHSEIITEAFELHTKYSKSEFDTKIQSLYSTRNLEVGISTIRKWISRYEDNRWIKISKSGKSLIVEKNT